MFHLKCARSLKLDVKANIGSKMKKSNLQLQNASFSDLVLRGKIGKGALLLALIGVGLLTLSFILSTTAGQVKHFLFSYLTAFCYFLSLSLGALFFICVQHVTKASWSILIRRIAEFILAPFVVLAILSIPILLGANILYEWTDKALIASDTILKGKSAYLNLPFFTARGVFYFVVWITTSIFLLRLSLIQDKSKDPGITLTLQRMSAPILILFGFTLTFFSFDFMMSLEPYWYSTIYGVYFFAGSAVSIFALLIALSAILESLGYFRGVLKIDHYHNLGKFLFGFIIFWAYIGFSQFMLIWYANITEETVFFAKRFHGSWSIVSLIILIGHFIIPFLGLISRFAKRRKQLLVTFAVWMLVMHYVDIYWLIMPEFSGGIVPPGLIELSTMFGFFAIVVSSFLYLVRRYSLVPVNDPCLEKSLRFAELS